MKKVFYIIIFFVFFLIMNVKQSMATMTCNMLNPNPINIQNFPITFNIQTSGDPSTWVRNILVHCQTGSWLESPRDFSINRGANGLIQFTMEDNHVPDITQLTCLLADRQARIELKGGEQSNSNNILCTVYAPVVNSYNGPRCNISINPNPPNAGQQFKISVTNVPDGENLKLEIGVRSFQNVGLINGSSQVFDSPQTFDSGANVNLIVTGTVNGVAYEANNPICEAQFTAGGSPLTNINPKPKSGLLSYTNFCEFAGDSKGKCEECAAKQGVLTPFGCIEADPQLFVQKVLRIAIGIAGGIAFLMMGYGAIMIALSANNPEKLNQNKEIIMSAIAGLLLIVFSAVILRIIGVDILQIPGF